jgi:hypothetical protein
MQTYNKMASPRFRRITLRISSIEIELRTTAPMAQEQPTREERALRRAQAEELMDRERDKVMMRWTLGL